MAENNPAAASVRCRLGGARRRNLDKGDIKTAEIDLYRIPPADRF